MRSDTRLGSFEEVAAAAAGHAPTLAAIRAIVAEVHPEATEFASRRERSVSWGFGAAKMRQWYAYAMPHRTHVNLGFFQGVGLPDPERLLTGTGKVLRHVKLNTPEDAGRPAIRALVAAAVAERARVLDLE